MSTTPYINIFLPTVGPQGTPGPDWATDINQALTLIDSHDHTPGNGKQLTLSSLIINQALQMNSNQISQIASLALDNLGTQPTDANLIYEYNGELFFNDASANQVQITSGGAINVASLGAITGDYSTSSADLTYNDTTKTYSFFQNTGLYANVDHGPLKIYRNELSSPYFIIKQSALQTGNLDWTLPASYPASTLPLKVSPAGVLSTGLIQTVEIGDGQVTNTKMAANSVDTINIKDASVTRAKLANDVGQQISSTVVSYSNSTTVEIDVGISVTITTNGRPVILGLKANDSNLGYISTIKAGQVIIYEGALIINTIQIGLVDNLNETQYHAPSSINLIRPVAAGTYTYKIAAKCTAGSSNISFIQTQLYAYELF